MGAHGGVDTQPVVICQSAGLADPIKPAIIFDNLLRRRCDGGSILSAHFGLILWNYSTHRADRYLLGWHSFRCTYATLILAIALRDSRQSSRRIRERFNEFNPSILKLNCCFVVILLLRWVWWNYYVFALIWYRGFLCLGLTESVDTFFVINNGYYWPKGWRRLSMDRSLYWRLFFVS